MALKKYGSLVIPHGAVRGDRPTPIVGPIPSLIRKSLSILACVFMVAPASATTPVKIGFPLEVALGLRSSVELEFQTEYGLIYQVEVSGDLIHWANDGYAILGTGGPKTYITSTWNLPRLFFRVRNNGDPNRVLAGGTQGPVGPPGPPGPPGLPPGSYATAEQGAKADTALQPGFTPSSIEAQAFWAALSGTSFRDRFDRPERYAEGRKISNLAFMPEIGPAWKVAVSDPINLLPYIDKGGFRSADNVHCYLGNSVSSPGGKFSLFFEFSIEPTEFTSSPLRLGMNTSFDSNTMITENGGIIPGGVVHINWDDYGIRTLDFFNNPQGFVSNPAKDTLQITEHQFRTGEGFTISSDLPPLPLAKGVPYYARVISDTEIQVATSPANAIAGNIIDITTAVPALQTLSYIHEPFSAINRTAFDGIFHWHPDKIPLTPNKRYVLYIKVDGSILEVGIAGMGSVLLENPQLQSHVGKEKTNFWWEPGGATIANGWQYKNIGKLHSVWSQPDVNTAWLSSFGGEQLPQLGSAGPYNFTGTINSSSQGNLEMKAPLPELDFRFIAGADSSLPRGGHTVASGGHVFAEGGYLSNVGGTDTGSEMLGRAPMAIDNHLVDPVRSAENAENTIIKQARFTPLLEPGDSEEFKFYGMLNGLETKRIRLTTRTTQEVIFDSGAISLAAVEGPFSIELFRHAGSNNTQTCYIKFEANGVNLTQRYLQTQQDNNPGTLDLRATGITEGGITLEALHQVVYRVKNQ